MGRRAWWILGATLTACVGAEDESAADAPDPATVDEIRGLTACAQQSTSATSGVVRCTRLFAEAPYLRLSTADRATATQRVFYGAFVAPETFADTLVIYDRDATPSVAVDAMGHPLKFTAPGGPLGRLGLPTNKIYSTVYRFEAKPHASVTIDGVRMAAVEVTRVAAAVEVDGCAADSLLLGRWEGTVTTRLSPAPANPTPFTPLYDPTRTVPIAVTLVSATRTRLLTDWRGGTVAGQYVYQLRGTIEDFAALTALGDRNPFLGATSGAIDAFRIGSMHGVPNDNHWVFDYPSGSRNLTTNGMSFTMTAFSTAALIAPAQLPAALQTKFRELVVRPHLPYVNSGHVITIHPVAIGAQEGQCGT